MYARPIWPPRRRASARKARPPGIAAITSPAVMSRAARWHRLAGVIVADDE